MNKVVILTDDVWLAKEKELGGKIQYPGPICYAELTTDSSEVFRSMLLKVDGTFYMKLSHAEALISLDAKFE